MKKKSESGKKRERTNYYHYYEKILKPNRREKIDFFLITVKTKFKRNYLIKPFVYSVYFNNARVHMTMFSFSGFFFTS